jgi:multidrug transporter EmrE-like cation transporter
MPALLPSYAALLVSVLLGVSGQILLKTGAERSADTVGQFLDAFTIVGLVTYALAAVFYIFAIKKIPVSLAFPTVSLSYVAVAIAAHYLWGEPLGLRQFVGMALIATGIFFLHRV